MKINKLCLYFLIILAGVIMPNVKAYVNEGLVQGLVLPTADAIRYYGWSSETNYTQRALAYSADYDDYNTNFRRAYYYLTNSGYSNDINGFSYLINTGMNLVSGQNYDLNVVLCSTNSNQWWTNWRAGVGDWGSSRTQYVTKGGNTWTNLGTYYTDGTNFTMCRNIGFNFTTTSSGSVINLRLVSGSTVALGQLSFMGYSLSSNGYNYSSQLDGLSTSISNLNTSISNSTQSIINNNNTNAQNIINNQNTNAQQAHTDSVNTQNTIKDSSVDSPNTSITSVKNSIATNGVITSLVVLPVTLFQAILNSVNGTCATFSLGSLYGTNLTLPCINVSNYIGSTLWGSIDVIVSGIFVYMISRKMVKVFNQLSSLKEGDVLDG